MLDEYKNKKKLVEDKKAKKKAGRINVQSEKSDDSFMNESDHDVISIRSTSKSRTEKSIVQDK